jgi:hypothetical protein
MIEEFEAQNDHIYIVLDYVVMKDFQPKRKLNTGESYIDGKDVKQLDNYPSVKKVHVIFKKLVNAIKIPGEHNKNQTGDVAVLPFEDKGENYAIVLFFVRQIAKQDELFDNLSKKYEELKSSEFDVIADLAAELEKNDELEKKAVKKEIDQHSKKVQDLVKKAHTFNDAKGYGKLCSLGLLDENGKLRIEEKHVDELVSILSQNEFDRTQLSYRGEVVGVENSEYKVQIFDQNQNTAIIKIPEQIDIYNHAVRLFCAFKMENASLNLQMPENAKNLDGFGVSPTEVRPTKIDFPFSDEEAIEFFSANLRSSDGSSLT